MNEERSQIQVDELELVSRSGRFGKYRLRVSNRGTTNVTIALSGRCEGLQTAVVFCNPLFSAEEQTQQRNGAVTLPAGSDIDIDVEVISKHAALIEREMSHRFSVTVEAASLSAITRTATMVQTLLVPNWLGRFVGKVRRELETWFAKAAVTLIIGAVVVAATVTVHFFSDNKTRALPNVVGMTADDARESLFDSGFKNVDFTHHRPDERIKGTVLEQTPGPDANYKVKRAISITISDGPSPFAIPDVVGIMKNSAVSLLEKQQLRVIVSFRVDTNKPSNIVLSQNPLPGQEILPGDTVELTVSGGVEAVVVPDLRNMLEQSAVEKLNALSLVPKTETRQIEDGGREHRVLAQSAAPGATLRTGEVVTLVVGVR